MKAPTSNAYLALATLAFVCFVAAAILAAERGARIAFSAAAVGFALLLLIAVRSRRR